MEEPLLIKAMAKPLHKSGTVRSIVLSYLASLVPYVDLIAREGRVTSVHLAGIFGTLVFAAIAIESRHDATEIVWTPKGLPGRNRNEAIAIESGDQERR